MKLSRPLEFGFHGASHKHLRLLATLQIWINFLMLAFNVYWEFDHDINPLGCLGNGGSLHLLGKTDPIGEY